MARDFLSMSPSQQSESQKIIKHIGGKEIFSEECPKYQRVNFDISNQQMKFLEGVKSKLKMRYDDMTKVDGTNWGCHTSVLKTTVLALMYSVAKYCAPVL